MSASDIINEIAASQGVDGVALSTYLSQAGWDFSPLTGADNELDFARKTIAHYAGMMAERQRKIDWANAQIKELRQKRLTAAARANPERCCGKCDGAGRILAFSHIANGACFQCEGTGVLELRTA
jgi:hypothetical protein